MIGPDDDATEYLLEEYALDRLDGEGLARAEQLLRERPALRRRVDDQRREAALLSGSLEQSASDPEHPAADATLALLIDGALDELERASLEASLAGDLRSQARLADLYRETQDVMNDAPLPEREAVPAATAAVLPFARRPSTRPGAMEVVALVVSAGLVIASLMTPQRIGVPLLFLALAAFGSWAAKRASHPTTSPSTRARTVLGLATAAIAFAAGLFAGPLSLWCYVCAAAWYWYWLVQRWSPERTGPASVEVGNTVDQVPRAGSGRR